MKTSITEVVTHIAAVGLIDTYTVKNISDTAGTDAQNSGLEGPHNGPADAYRHCLWSCEMSQQLGTEQAKKIGDIHEKYGDKRFPGETCMDLNNNKKGRDLSDKGSCSVSCLDALNNNQLQTAPSGNPPIEIY